VFWRRWNFLLWPFLAPLTFLLLYHFFAASWSNRCDPGNATFLLMKNDPIVGFKAPGQMFTWESDGPDNSWMCSSPSMTISHVGPDVGAMFDATRDDMTRNGWVETAPIPGGDFAVYEKVIEGVRFDATVEKGWFGVDVNLNGPDGPHFGEMGFGSS
jgi:hypothetical protein